MDSQLVNNEFTFISYLEPYSKHPFIEINSLMIQLNGFILDCDCYSVDWSFR